MVLCFWVGQRMGQKPLVILPTGVIDNDVLFCCSGDTALSLPPLLRNHKRRNLLTGEIVSCNLGSGNEHRPGAPMGGIAN